METIKDIIGNQALDRGFSPEKIKERLAEFEQQFRNGDGYALIRALGFCAVLNLYIPKWVVDGLCALDEGLSNLRYETPDEALRWGRQSYQNMPSRKSSLTDKSAILHLIHNAADLKFNYFSKGEKRPDGATFSHGEGLDVIAKKLSENQAIQKQLRYKTPSKNRATEDNPNPEQTGDLVTEDDLKRMKKTSAIKSITQAKNDPNTNHAWCVASVDDGSIEWLIENVRKRRPLE
ncbi:MAG: hypothetical protein ACJA05_000109 [Porticoccus sp.]|uniref:hypothetical protein n=1 Tax=Porticoccus sp. TaxID=2024853 RepID=UPI0039E3D7F6